MNQHSSFDFSQRPVVRSFDVFDTLLARAVCNPTDVFDIVERSGIADFKNLRIKAQSLSNHTWDNIYEHYKTLSGVNNEELERIKSLEIQAEIDVSYLVSENYRQVRDGDILVSDMYLPPEKIMTILRAVGFERSVSLFVSSDGKASGRIWSEIRCAYEIEHHIGDNLRSDVESPTQSGIRSSHYRNCEYTFMEKIFLEIGASNTANLLKRFRLTDPFETGTLLSRLYDAQSACNVPVLLLLASQINDIMVTENLSRVLFSTRDGCLLQPIFETLFPGSDVHKFHCSRIAYTERRSSYLEYLKKVYAPNTSLIFDLHGMFKSGRNLFQEVFGSVPRVHIFSGAHNRAPSHPNITHNIERGQAHIELLNLDVVGPLITVSSDGSPIRAPLLDNSAEIGMSYRVIVATFIELIRPFITKVKNELASKSAQVPWVAIHQYICTVVDSHVDLSNIQQAEHQSLTMLANHYGTDKGSVFACAHCYTYAYERIFQEVDTKTKISLLEIGLNRSNNTTIPSLHTWRDYFGRKVVLYGMDVDPAFARFHNPEGGIHIVIGDQSNSSDLIRVGVANPHGFDVIIDDGYHASEHQQITLKMLWKFLLPGGFFVIEDLHFQPILDDTPDTRELLRAWSQGRLLTSKYMDRVNAQKICDEAASITFFDSLSLQWPQDKTTNAIAVLRKRF